MTAPQKGSRRVLVLVTGVFARGGIERYARYYIQALRELLGEAQVGALSLLGPEEHSFDSPFPVDYASKGLSLPEKVRFVRHSLGWGARWRPDAVICNHVSLAPLGFLLSRRAKAPYAVLAYGHEVWSGLSPLRRACLKAAARIQTDCDFTRRYLVRSLPYPAERTDVIHDCVDTERFRPMQPPAGLADRYQLPERKGRVVLMTVSRLVRGTAHKGHARVFEALTRIPAERRPLYVVGGDGEDRPRLEELARRMGLRACVHFAGAVAEADLPAFYNLCDAFLLVSEFGKGKGEGLPVVLLEASACAKPIIAGNEDGSAEAVEEGANGLLVSPRDNEALAGAIRRLGEDAQERARMGAHGRERVLSLFSYPVFHARVGEFLHRLCPNHAG